MQGEFSIKRTVTQYSVLTALGLVVFFLLMKLTGLVYHLELRFLNFFILAGGVMLAIKGYREETRGPIDYLEGFGVGFFTSLLSGLIFSAFLFLYLSFLDTGFMEYLRINAPMGSELNPLNASFGILIEATASGSILALLGLQYYRRPRGHHSFKGNIHHHV